MRIVADRNIPEIETVCEGLGEIRLFDSRDPAKLHDLLKTAEILLCRSTINVNAGLLEGTPVRFVATATSGTDHFDTGWLDAQGIAYASAAGSNARSVAEWWTAVALELHASGRIRLAGATVGIVGVGHVGTEVAEVAQALEMDCLFNDPPRAARGEQPVTWSSEGFVTMAEILDSDIVTLHVPLTRDGEFPTSGFFGESQFVRMHPGALFVNTARGGVMDSAAVLRWAAEGNPLALDVYPGEPRIDPALVRAADIATPHIAGHAWDGKLLGTEMVYEALCEWLEVKRHRGTKAQSHKGTEAQWHRGTEAQRHKGTEARRHKGTEAQGHKGTEAQGHKGTEAPRYGGTETLRQNAKGGVDLYGEALGVVRGVYDVRVDDVALRRAVEMAPGAAAAEFARLRAEYAVRREFAAREVDASGLSDASVSMLSALGFRFLSS